MALELTPGTEIRIKVARTPACEHAAKTLSRIFAKDKANRSARRHRKALRASASRLHRRGGRPWAYLPHAPRLFQPVKGSTCSVLVTPDLVGDIRSVERFIQVEPAK